MELQFVTQRDKIREILFKVNRAESTAQSLSLIYGFGDFVRQHHGYKIGSLEMAWKVTCSLWPCFSHYFRFVPLSDNRNGKNMDESSFIGNLALLEYSSCGSSGEKQTRDETS